MAFVLGVLSLFVVVFRAEPARAEGSWSGPVPSAIDVAPPAGSSHDEEIERALRGERPVAVTPPGTRVDAARTARNAPPIPALAALSDRHRAHAIAPSVASIARAPRVADPPTRARARLMVFLN